MSWESPPKRMTPCGHRRHAQDELRLGGMKKTRSFECRATGNTA